MKRAASLIGFVVITFLLLAGPARVARCDEYIDKLFAPPTAEELKTVYDETRYEPRCESFATGEVYLETPEYIAYKITYLSDGLKQTGLFGRPKRPGRFPLAMINHAGFSGFLMYDNPRLVQYLDNGYAVAVATYRGEAGVPGRAEGKMDVLGDEVHDILNLMECAAASEKVDPDRIVMLGVSHGGGLTLSALTQTRRVKAAAIASAPSNLMNENMKKMAAQWRTQPGAVEVGLQILMPPEGIKKMKAILGVKEKDPARIPAARREMLRRSPAMFADYIVTPLIMFYGGKDPVAYAGDGKNIAASLNKRGITAKVTVFEERGHGYTPAESVEAFKQILDFFAGQLKKTG